MTFKSSIAFPFDHIQHGEEFVSMEAVHECARTIEKAGFHSGTVTDHPIPSSRWLDAGGHYAQDPFVMLAMVAAVTTTLRLQTNIIVLPYRNPFITARAISSLDIFSGGRVIMGLGAGYLKPEYKALGVDFDNRNDLMDEYLKAMKLAWTGEDFAFEGSGYTAVGNRMLPTPAQRPHPPLLIGGNAKRAIRRAVELGDVWNPFIVPEIITNTARTASLARDEDFRAAVDYMNEHCEKVGRATPPPIICSGDIFLKRGFDPQESLDKIAHYKSLGVSGYDINIDAATRSEWCELTLRFGEEVLSKVD